ncbi:T9SS type B sorting domain-containing protein [Flavobacterium sp. I3-2]|uniref:T9SS type B sorting domain-containing protein n=1 Tax=Flavobacterium sp. I3-2 TaxID=2748319 RepID=UPI0015ADCD66|nr:T9SS type B sorting domain-containing protein [Flavobacterium sp. I3-2]
MRNKYLLLFLLFLIQYQLNAQDFQWVRQIKGISHEYKEEVIDIAVDTNQNSYTIGDTRSSYFDLDPTPDGELIIDNSNIQNFSGTYLFKLDAAGNFIWGHTFGNLKTGDHALKVKIGTDSNIYAILSISELNTNLNIIENFIKIFKISPSGNILSTISIPQFYGYSNSITPFDIELDNENNIYVTGYFIGNVNINNNPNFNLNNNNGIGNFVFKINNDGNLIWSKQININFGIKNKLALRPDGNINLCIDNSNNYHLINIDTNDGATIWEKIFNNQYYNNFHVNQNGIVILGKKDHYTTIDVDPSENSYEISGDFEYLIFLNLDGSLLDVKKFQKEGNDNIQFDAVTSDSDGNYYLAGKFTNTIDLDPSPNNTFIFSLLGDSNMFSLKLDMNRNFVNAFQFGQEVPLQSPYNICMVSNIKKVEVVNENLFITGEFLRTCDFNPSPTENATLYSVNIVTIVEDGFLLKIKSCNSNAPNGDSIQTFCNTQQATVQDLTPNYDSIKWYDSINSSTPLNTNTPLQNGQTYFASSQVGTCVESNRLAVTVSISDIIAPLVNTNQIFCSSLNPVIANLEAIGENLKWYSNPNDTVSLNNNISLQNNTDYYVSQTFGNCESERKLVHVSIVTNDPPIAISPQIFCLDNNPKINSISIEGQNIKWYDSLINGNLIPSNTNLINGQTYYASQTLNNCESLRIPILVNIQNIEKPNGPENQTFCQNQNQTLNNIAVEGSNIKWYNENGILLPNNTILVNNTTYYASQTINNCESSNRLAVNISFINTLNANDYSDVICDTDNNYFENIDLTDYTLYLIDNYNDYSFEYYSTLTGANNQINADAILNFTNFTLTNANSTIFVRIQSDNNCFQVVKLNLTLISIPNLDIKNSYSICKNEQISIDAGAEFDSYDWSTGETTRIINISEEGEYFVTVTKNYENTSCTQTKYFSVKHSITPVIKNIRTQDWTDSENEITIEMYNYGNFEYSIDDINYQKNNTFKGLKSGEYTAIVKDLDGCGFSQEDFYLLNYPKFFTPNNDGKNDTWKIEFGNFEPNLEISIFDRNGKLLKTMKNIDSWDGNLNGKPLPSNDYWFVVTRQNGKNLRGHFTLKR